MPDMPEPPMPTKWMDLTLCRMRELLAQVRAAPRGVRLAEDARAARHRNESRAIEAAQHAGELLGRRLELLHRDAGPALGEERGIRGLLVGHEPRQRKEDGRDARGGDLRDGDGARAA